MQKKESDLLSILIAYFLLTLLLKVKLQKLYVL